MKVTLAVNVIGLITAFQHCDYSLFGTRTKYTPETSMPGSAIMKCAALCLGRKWCKYFTAYPKCRLKKSQQKKFTFLFFDIAIFPKRLAGFIRPTMASSESTSPPVTPLNLSITWINTRWRRKPAPKKKDPCFGYTKFSRRKKAMCYRLHNEVGQPAAWTKANERCTSEGARLAIVKSKEQFNALKTILSKGTGSIIAMFQRNFNRKIWIGLRKNKWVDGTKATTGTRQDLCAALDFGPPFKTNFYNCKMDNFFVCEKEMKSESGLMTN